MLIRRTPSLIGCFLVSICLLDADISVPQKQRCKKARNTSFFFPNVAVCTARCTHLDGQSHLKRQQGRLKAGKPATGIPHRDREHIGFGFLLTYFFILHLFVLCGLYPTPLSHYFQFVCPELNRSPILIHFPIASSD